MPFADLASARLHYLLSGPASAPVLVLSNSLGTSLQLWDSQLSALDPHFRLLRYDTRGHGQSTAPPGPYTLNDLTGDVLGLLDHLAISEASICGISLGGLTALALALRAPARIRRLVAANTAARIGTVQGWSDRIHQVEREGMAALTEATLARWFTPHFPTTGNPALPSVRAMLGSTSPTGYIACCAALRDADLTGGLSSIQAPALIIAGSHDPVTPPSDGRFLQANISGSQLHLLPAAHLSNIEQAEAFNALLLDFLQP